MNRLMKGSIKQDFPFNSSLYIHICKTLLVRAINLTKGIILF